MKDCRPNHSETFGNVLKSFGDHPVTYVIRTYDFRLEILYRLEFKKNVYNIGRLYLKDNPFKVPLRRTIVHCLRSGSFKT